MAWPFAGGICNPYQKATVDGLLFTKSESWRKPHCATGRGSTGKAFIINWHTQKEQAETRQVKERREFSPETYGKHKTEVIKH